MSMMRVWRTDQLYPPDKPALTQKLLEAVLTDEKTPDGKFILRRQFDDDERADLEHRLKTLEPWIVRPQANQIEPLLLELFVRFNVREEKKEMAVRVKTFTDILVDTPLWAIKRAVDRFSQGLVTPEEIKERSILRGNPPNSAHLHLVAANLVRPIYLELAHLRRALEGHTVRRAAPTVDQMRSVGEKAAAVRNSLGADGALMEAQRALLAAGAAKTLVAANEHVLREEYRRAGVDVPVAQGGILVSLSTLLTLGYKIEEVAGRKELTAPRRPTL